MDGSSGLPIKSFVEAVRNTEKMRFDPAPMDKISDEGELSIETLAEKILSLELELSLLRAHV